jgi:arsenate reductase
MLKILVLCTGNSCRSQIAQGLLRHAFRDRAEIYSAGVEVHGLNQNAVRYLKHFEDIDISHHTSNHIDEYKDVSFDYVLTVCDHAKETCPWFPTNAKKIHKNISDPTKVSGTELEVRSAYWQTIMELRKFCYDFAKAVQHEHALH